VDYLTDFGSYANAVDNWVDIYLALQYNNGTVLADFFSECLGEITTAICKSYYVDCSVPTQQPCTSACGEMKSCREGVMNASGIDVGLTNFWTEDCTAYSTCDGYGNTVCCWNPNGVESVRASLVLMVLAIVALWKF